MKKIVIAMLLILPLIIVSVVMLAANVISAEIYIAVDGVDIHVQYPNRTMQLDLSDGQRQFNASVRPSAAQNKSLIWSLENISLLSGDTPDLYPTVDQNGLVKFKTICTFDLVVTSKEGNKKARLNIYVKSEKVTEIEITAEKTELQTGETIKLAAKTTPSAVVVKAVTWSSSDANVLEIDGNGIATAKSAGNATVTVKWNDAVLHSLNFTVTKGATRFGTDFYLSAESFDIAALDPLGAVGVKSGGTLSENTFTFTSDIAELLIGGETVTIRKCASDDIVIKNAEFLTAEAVHSGRLPLYITVVYLDAMRRASGDKPAQIISVGDNSIGTVSDGVLTLKKSGTLVVTVQAAGKIEYIILNVVTPIDYVRLNEINAEDKRGIAEETIFGTKQITDGSIVNYKKDFALMYPENASWDDFIVEIDKPHLVSFNNGTLEIIGVIPALTDITIKVTPVHKAFDNVGAERVMHFLDGVNCTSFSDIKTAAGLGRAIMIQSEIVCPAASEAETTVELKANYYGNGYLVDGSALGRDRKAGRQEFTNMFLITADNVKVSNANWRFDDGAKIAQTNGMSGTVLAVGEVNQRLGETSYRLKNIVLEYSLLENSYFAINTANCDLLINGCILRNTSNFGINLLTTKRSDGTSCYSDLVMNNTVMHNIIAVAIGIAVSESMGNLQQSSFKQTGFFDCYNWQDVTSGAMLDRDFLPDNPQLNSALKTIMQPLIKGELEKEDYDGYRYDADDGIKYIHLAVVSAGAVNECKTTLENGTLVFEDPRMRAFPMDSINGTLETLRHVGIKMYPIGLYAYDNKADITPFTKYEETAELYARLRGK